MRGAAPVGCAMLLVALVLGIVIGLLLPGPTASRAPSRPAITPVAAMRDVAAAIADPATPPVPTAAPRVQPDPVPVVVSKATPEPPVRPRNGLRGQVSWFRAPGGTAAAGKPLRAFLGRGWRGQTVRACGPAGCASVRLTDWMGNPRRVLDLNTAAFQAICGPLSRGVCRVIVR